MEYKLQVDIYIDGEEILHFSGFTLEQKFNAHHVFELRISQEAIEGQGAISLDKSKNFMGKDLNVEFGRQGGKTQIFAGKITRVEFSQGNGYQGDLIISGYSPTILLERGPNLGSYLAKDLKSIVQKAASDAPANILKMKVKPARAEIIDYIIQYRESDFEFINRLSAEYHEWFFYDGTQLNFGKPDKLNTVPLIYGRNLQNLHYGLQISPLKYTKFSYNPGKNEVLTSEGKGQASGTTDMLHAISSSNEVYSKGYTQPIPIRVDSKKDIDDYVQNEQKAIIADLVRVNGSGDDPTVTLGGIVDISMSKRIGITSDFNLHDFGKFLVTSLYHHIDGLGHYYNTFEGVAADTERLIVDSFTKPSPDIQLATVIDNDDPNKQSRIKVKFKWETTKNDPTEWLRIITPSAGSDDQGGSNRGFITIPEKNDQVLIAFEEGNIARPVVMGSVYHTHNGNSQKQQSNHIKSMSTRSGHLIEFDDSADTQGIKITDRNNNVIHIDTHGNNITITAVETMTLNAKNLNINVGEDVKLTAGRNMDVSVKQKSSADAMDVAITASNSIAASGKASVKVDSAQIEVAGTTHTKVSGGTLDLEGTGMANVKAPMVKIN